MTSCIPTDDGRDITPEDDEHIAWVNSGFRAGYQKAKRETQPRQSFYEVFGSSKAGQSKEPTYDELAMLAGAGFAAYQADHPKPQPNTDSLEGEIAAIAHELRRSVQSNPVSTASTEQAVKALTQLFNKYARDIIGEDEPVAAWRANPYSGTNSAGLISKLKHRNQLRQEQRAKLKEEK